jgi:hypothetical protein
MLSASWTQRLVMTGSAPACTVTLMLAVWPQAVAVSVCVPGRSASSHPSAVTRTLPGAADHVAATGVSTPVALRVMATKGAAPPAYNADEVAESTSVAPGEHDDTVVATGVSRGVGSEDAKGLVAVPTAARASSAAGPVPPERRSRSSRAQASTTINATSARARLQTIEPPSPKSLRRDRKTDPEI